MDAVDLYDLETSLYLIENLWSKGTSIQGSDAVPIKGIGNMGGGGGS